MSFFFLYTIVEVIYLRIINREALKQLIDKSHSEYISELAVHTFFSMYGQEHFDDKGDNENELEGSTGKK